MDDALLNCLTGACCPPELRAPALVKYMREHKIETPEQFAAFLFENFDLAPAGTLVPLVKDVSRLARGADYKG